MMIIRNGNRVGVFAAKRSNIKIIQILAQSHLKIQTQKPKQLQIQIQIQ